MARRWYGAVGALAAFTWALAGCSNSPEPTGTTSGPSSTTASSSDQLTTAAGMKTTTLFVKGMT